MTPRANKALELSIKKWEGIIVGDRMDLGLATAHCAANSITKEMTGKPFALVARL